MGEWVETTASVRVTRCECEHHSLCAIDAKNNDEYNIREVSLSLEVGEGCFCFQFGEYVRRFGEGCLQVLHALYSFVEQQRLAVVVVKAQEVDEGKEARGVLEEARGEVLVQELDPIADGARLGELGEGGIEGLKIEFEDVGRIFGFPRPEWVGKGSWPSCQMSGVSCAHKRYQQKR